MYLLSKILFIATQLTIELLKYIEKIKTIKAVIQILL